jgi:hypothetical protein
VQVPAKLVVSFKAGRELGQRLAELNEMPGEAAAGVGASTPFEVGPVEGRRHRAAAGEPISRVLRR